MRELTNFVFFENGSEAKKSGIAVNPGADSLGIQVSGTFTGLTLEVQGRVDALDETNNNFVPLFVLNLSTAGVMENITGVGNYEVAVETQKQIRLEIKAITSGSAYVFGRFVNTSD